MAATEVRIRSVGTALPGAPIDNGRLARLFGMGEVWEQWVDAFVGTRTRHLSRDLDTGRQYCSLADLCTTAARQALDKADLQSSDIDLMVLGTATPDQLMPAVVNIVADRLGIDGVRTYQLQSGCSGAVQALELAHDLLQAGTHRNALVLGADTCAKHFDTDIDVKTMPPAQLVNLLLFGDAAGAAVLSADDGGGDHPGAVAIRRVFTRLTGLGREAGQTLEWFGLADRDDDRPAAGENYKMIEESVPGMSAEVLAELLAALDWTGEDFDFLLPPQLSGRMTRRIVELLDVPGAQEVSCVEETGNTGNALPFLQLERALAEMAPGDRAVGVAIESSKWIKAGFALDAV
ncbi:MAG TPA: 3-oxoacyl-ACP synthase III family protein [Actinocrinis sp.]